MTRSQKHVFVLTIHYWEKNKQTVFVTKYVMTSFKKHILHTTYIIVLKEHNFGSISERVLIQSSKHAFVLSIHYCHRMYTT